ncbi:ESX secretion-associated protein EspG [Nocardia pseudovaccinii]|uniref:ESX secretion-associated protein EspG n=1 Tax=Nocardia pseudovaccinii TaxID=189540 RepID=UPI003D8DA1D9
MATNDEVATHRAAVCARYGVEETEQINLALHTLTTSELRIEIAGDSTVLGKGEPREYRVLGARTPYHAVMLTQTATGGVDSPIRCRLFRTEQLAARLAAILPPVLPGSAKPGTFHVEDLGSSNNGHGHGRNSPLERFDRLTQHRSGAGVAGLLAGYLHSRPAPWYALGWFDTEGDGRYVQQQTREHITVRPATTGDLTNFFETWIELALKRLRGDDPDNW